MAYLDGNDNLVPDKNRGLVIRFSMDDGQEIICALEHALEAPAEFFEQVFIGIMDDLKLVGKKNDARGVCVVQPDLCFVGEHAKVIPAKAGIFLIGVPD